MLWYETASKQTYYTSFNECSAKSFRCMFIKIVPPERGFYIVFKVAKCTTKEGEYHRKNCNFIIKNSKISPSLANIDVMISSHHYLPDKHGKMPQGSHPIWNNVIWRVCGKNRITPLLSFFDFSPSMYSMIPIVSYYIISVWTKQTCYTEIAL